MGDTFIFFMFFNIPSQGNEEEGNRSEINIKLEIKEAKNTRKSQIEATRQMGALIPLK